VQLLFVKEWIRLDNNFDKIIDKAREVVDVLSKKTDEMVTLSKLKIKRSNVKGELQNAYSKLGGAVYEAKKEGKNNDELIALIVSEIDEITNSLHKIEAEIELVSSTARCKTCGSINPKDAYYCQHCGAVVTPVPDVDDEAVPSSDEDVSADGTQTDINDSVNNDENF